MADNFSAYIILFCLFARLDPFGRGKDRHAEPRQHLGDGIIADVDPAAGPADPLELLYWAKKVVLTDWGIMKDAAWFASPNDSGGMTGVFSSAGAASGMFSCGTSEDIVFWASWAAHASDNRKDIAMTNDGGATWHNITGDWNSAVAAYDGGTAVIYPEIKWVSL